MSEQWREIPGWEGFYAVSDQGRVKSLARSVPGRPGVFINKRERILKPTPKFDKYLVVGLCRNNTKATLLVHHLVLLAFVGPRPEGAESCHYDGNRTNNYLENLRWDTRSSNTFDKVRHGTHPQSSKTHCRRGHPYDEANTYIAPGKGGRHCRACFLINKRAYNERKRNAA